jgi:hypothetical protein
MLVLSYFIFVPEQRKRVKAKRLGIKIKANWIRECGIAWDGHKA